MQLQIQAKNFDLDQMTENYAREKIEGLEKFISPILEGHAVLEIDKKHHNSDKFATIEVRIPIGKELFYGKESGINMEEAIDLVAEKLEKQLLKFKDKMHHKDKEALKELKEDKDIL